MRERTLHINLHKWAAPAATPLHNFARNDRGVVAIIVALSLTMLMGFVALAIDVGMLYRERAQLQAKSDVAALSAVPDLEDAQARVDNALESNNQSADALVELELGRYLRNPAIPMDERFTALPNGTPGINAISIGLSKESPLYFAQVFLDEETADVGVRSTALRTGAASFSLGSHLAMLDDFSLSEALNESLSLNIAFDVGDVSVLQGIEFSAADLLNALSDIIGFNALNPAEILDQTISTSALISALQTVAPVGLPSTVSELAAGSDIPDFTMRELISGSETDLGLTTMDFLSDTIINANDVLTSLATPGASGSAISLDVSASAPGLLDFDTELSVGEPVSHSGVIAMGEVGTTLHNAAARLKTDIALSTDILGSLGVGVEVASVNVPLYTELAGTTAELTELSCKGESSDDIIAEFETSHSELHPGNGTSVAALYLGNLPGNPMSSTSSIDPSTLEYADLLEISIEVQLLLVTLKVDGIVIQARSHVALGESQTESIDFTRGEFEAGQNAKTFGSGDILSSGVQSLLSPENLEIRTKPGGGVLNAAVGSVLELVLDALPGLLLSELLSPLDTVLDSTLSTIGLELGAGELTLTNHLCEVPKLVR